MLDGCEVMKIFILLTLLFSVNIFASTGSNLVLAKKRTVTAKLAIVLGSFSANSKDSKKICSLVQKSLSDWSFGTQPRAVCFTDSQALEKSKYDYYVSVSNDSPHGQYKLAVHNLSPEDETDPEVLRWEIKKGISGETMMRKLLAKYSVFDFHKTEIKRSFFDRAIEYSGEWVKISDNQYINTKQGWSGSFSSAYALYTAQNAQQKNYLAAGLEMTGVLGVATTGYYSGPGTSNPNNVDWDYSINGKPSSLQARWSGSGVRFDDNHFDTNEGHYLAGTVYYTLARNAGLTRLESILITFAGSSYWEYLGEYREIVSINDQINTTFGGFVLGETIFQMGKIFESAPNTPVNKFMKSLFHSPRSFSEGLERFTFAHKHFDGYEIKPDVWSKLDLQITKQKTSQGQDSISGGVDGQVVAIPMFEKPGQVKEILTDTVFARLTIDGTTSMAQKFKLFAKTILAAYYNKNLDKNPDGSLQGYNLIVGPSTALEVNQETFGKIETSTSPNSDFRGIVHILGNTIDIVGYHRGIKFRCTLDIYGDFAMIRSYAFDAYHETHDTSKADSVLVRKDYYYGYGTTEQLALSAEYGRFAVGIDFEQINSSKIEARPRHVEATDELHPTDSIFESDAYVVYQLSDQLKLQFGVEKTRRFGKILDAYNISSSWVNTYGRLIYVYK